MNTPDLYDEVVALLNEPGVDFKEIAERAEVNPKTLRRLAKRENDAMHATLKRIKKAFEPSNVAP